MQSAASPCGDLLCPIGRACARGTCVDDSLITACARVVNGMSCMVSEIGVGTCQEGLCLVGRCGDGLINAIDACDGTNLDGKTCLDFGSTDPAGLACTPTCSFDKSACTARCGDGIQQGTEACDGTDFGDHTCITEGFYEGTLVCMESCELNRGSCTGACGDGVLNNFTEDCDGEDFGSRSCSDSMLGYRGEVLPLTCTDQCAFEASSCTCGGELCRPNTQHCVRIDDILTCEDL